MINQIVKLYLLSFFLICSFLQVSFGKNNIDTLDFQGGGLKFLSQQVYVKDRTTLSLFPEYKKITSDLSISFDCDIYDTNRFGYIFRLIGLENGEEKVYFHLIQNPEILKPETYKIQLYSPVAKSKIEFTLEVKKSNKLHFKFLYNANKKTLTVNCNGTEKSITGINLNKVRSNIVFGFWGLDEDVAAMTLRNIRIQENNKTTYFWPLNEYDGTFAGENISGLISEVSNPIWLRKEHYYWKKLISFKANEMAGVIYNEKNQELHIINRDSMIVWSPNTENYQVVRYSGRRPFPRRKHFSTYNESKDEIMSYGFQFLNSSKGKKLYSILDEENIEWSQIDTTSRHLNNHHHRSFWNIKDGTFNTFAGYSDFTYYNDFKSFDFSTNTWTKIEMEGDFISPREYTVIGQQKETGLIYVYGGYGNESGQQALGGHIYKDLFSVDLSNKLIKKIMDFEEFTPDFVPHGSLIFGNKEGTIFYTLMGPKNYVLDLRLVEINAAKKTIIPVSDTLKVNMGSHKTHTKSNIYLFKDSVAQKLYCVCREVKEVGNCEITVYSLNFPPSNLPEILPVKKLGNSRFLLPGFGAILFFLVVMYFVRKQKVNSINGKKTTVEYFRQNKNAIWFLGGFQIFDSKGKDITYRFSKKLKELFVLIMIKTVHNKGINSKELSDKLWPGMNTTNQKNNRGVTINAVRKILDDIHGISLNNVNSRWVIECDGDCYFDYAHVNSLLSQTNYKVESNKIISLLNYGNLTPRLQFPWLDTIKAKYENDVLYCLYEICGDSCLRKNYLSCFDTANIIHEQYDQINEKALGFKIFALNKMKAYSKSQNEFNLFKKRYLANYKEEYKRTINEIEYVVK